MRAVDRNPSTGHTFRTVLVAVICSTVLSVCATVGAFALLGENAGDDPPDAGAAQVRREAPPSEPVATDARGDALQAAILEARTEQARLIRANEQQAGEIAELKRRLGEAEARSLEIASVDPAQQKASALKALAAGRRGQPQIDIHAAVRDLVRLGDAAVPDVVAMLESGAIQSYGGGFTIGGEAVSTYADSRMAMIDVLRQIGTPLATRELLRTVAASTFLSDYRNLFLLCSKTEDARMTRGMSALVPGAFRRLAKSEGRDRSAQMLETCLAGWIRRHAVRAALPDLVTQVEQRPADYRGPDDFAGALVALSPDQAVAVARRMATKENGMAGVQRFAASHSFRRVPLAKLADFYERLFSTVNFSPEARMQIFARMPTRSPREIASIAERTADAKRLRSFLDAQLATERDPKTRKTLEGHLERLRKEIERAAVK